MAGIARAGDILGRFGFLIFPVSPDVFVNNRPVALEGCIYTGHPPFKGGGEPHPPGPTFAVPSGVTVNDLPPITKGSIGLCGDPVVTASFDVNLIDNGLGQVVSLGISAYNAYNSFISSGAGSANFGDPGLGY